jgi:hypothetical protein
VSPELPGSSKGEDVAFIVRQNEGNRRVLVLKYAAFFYWLMWPTLALTVLASVVGSALLYVTAAIAWVLLLAVAAPYWPVVMQLKRVMKEQPITATGSRYSFSNPLRYEWNVKDQE